MPTAVTSRCGRIIPRTPHYGLARALARLGRGDEALRSYTTYVAMENRPAEERWVASAKAEIAALEK